MEVYADYAATTPVKPEVIEAMMDIYQSHYGNPSSIHTVGRDARRYLDESRRNVAQYWVLNQAKSFLLVVLQNQIILLLKV